jgi:hypothetical protein
MSLPARVAVTAQQFVLLSRIPFRLAVPLRTRSCVSVSFLHLLSPSAFTTYLNFNACVYKYTCSTCGGTATVQNAPKINSIEAINCFWTPGTREWRGCLAHGIAFCSEWKRVAAASAVNDVCSNGNEKQTSHFLLALLTSYPQRNRSTHSSTLYLLNQPRRVTNALFVSLHDSMPLMFIYFLPKSTVKS